MSDDTTQPRPPLTFDEVMEKCDGFWRESWARLEQDLRADGHSPAKISASLKSSFDIYCADRPRLAEWVRRVLAGENVGDDRDIRPAPIRWKRLNMTTAGSKSRDELN